MRSVKSSRDEEIRRRAYEIWLARVAAGEGNAGDAVSDWLAAEEEIEEEAAARSDLLQGSSRHSTLVIADK
jgi:hypothetical protein